ncbi:hypothetical protein D3C72_1820680 [compost metagenome]
MVEADALVKLYQYGHLKSHHDAALWQTGAFVHWYDHVHLASVQVAKLFLARQSLENLFLKRQVHQQCFLKRLHAVQVRYDDKF